MGVATSEVLHPASVELSVPVQAQVEIGTEITLRVRVSCPLCCDLRGGSITILAGDRLIASSHLTAYDEEQGFNETELFPVTVPDTVGAREWTAFFPGQQIAGVVHQAGTVPISFETIPHRTSLAVWDIPDAVLVGARLTVKVGAKSSSGCPMKGAPVEICDGAGVTLTTGILGDTPWPGTSALYWTEIELEADQSDGIARRSARFAAPPIDAPHDGSSFDFTFATIRRPEHAVTVQVVTKEGAPLANVEVRLGAYKGATDELGSAIVQAATGTYEVFGWKSGFSTSSQVVHVTGDLTVQLESEVILRDDPWGQSV